VLHPIHIHGQFFTVRARNGEPVDEGTFRDTILLEPGDVIDVAMVATDIGTWLIHCHIQEHAEAGMAALLDVVP
jgi:FtsP/CotA-like multicopper oxidase with cupredoxin domain